MQNHVWSSARGRIHSLKSASVIKLYLKRVLKNNKKMEFKQGYSGKSRVGQFTHKLLAYFFVLITMYTQKANLDFS